MGLKLKSVSRLVEADVSIGADAQQLQINAAYIVNHGVIFGAGLLGIGICAVGEMGSGRIDVHPVKQVAVHKAVVALRMFFGQAAVLVKIDRGDL